MTTRQIRDKAGSAAGWLFRALVLLCALPFLEAETFRQSSFHDFSKGSFGDGGSNIYVSARGRIQLIQRLDLNRDSHLDLFVGNGHGHNENEDAIVYLHNGEEIDPRRRILVPSDSAVQALIADLDRDGTNDLVLVNSVGGNTGRTSTYVYYGREGSFPVEARRLLPAWRAAAGAIADWNADGWPDLALACANPGEDGSGAFSAVYWNSPAGFDPARMMRLPGPGAAVESGDFNSDGKVDLALADGDRISIYWGEADGLHPERYQDLPGRAHHLAAGDLNGDGRVDLVALDAQGVRIFLAVKGGLDPQAPAQLPMTNLTQAAVADLNRDGWPDLAVSRSHTPAESSRPQQGNEYTDSWVLWNREGLFEWSRATALPSVNARGIEAADLNGDGWDDLVLSQSTSIDNLDIQSFIYWNRAGGFEFARKSMLDTRGARSSRVGDVNGDGLPDLLFCNFEGGQRAGHNPNRIYWGDGSREFSVQRSSLLWSAYNVGTLQADLDDDGWPDLGSLEARYAQGRPDTLHGLYLWFGNAEGFSESRRVVLSVEDPRSGVTTADLNRDGYLDLVVGATEPSPEGEPGNVILYGGPAGFSPLRREVLPIGGAGRGPRVADLNKDGYLDLAGGSYGTGVHLFFGSAEGFRKDRILSPTQAVLDVEVADLDGDGWLDLIAPGVTPKFREGDLLIYYGSEQGFSEERCQRLPHLDGHDPTVADFNQDGRLDLLVVNESGDYEQNVSAYLYWGSPSGFSADRRLELPNQSGAAALPADFDGDGWIDIFLVVHKHDGDRNGSGNPVRHETDSFIYWNSPRGFNLDNPTAIPTSGPHAQMGRDPGNIYSRRLAETYISQAFQASNRGFRRIELDWEAETPGGTGVRLQVRSAPSLEGLLHAAWVGSKGPETWIDNPGEGVPVGSPENTWFQYRAELSTADGGSSPILTEVQLKLIE